jgi:hypothetical protein
VPANALGGWRLGDLAIIQRVVVLLNVGGTVHHCEREMPTRGIAWLSDCAAHRSLPAHALC